MNNDEVSSKVMGALVRYLTDYSTQEIAILTGWATSGLAQADVDRIIAGQALVDVSGYFIIVFPVVGDRLVQLSPFAGFYIWCELPHRDWFCQLTPTVKYGPFDTLTHVENFIKDYDIRRN